MALTDPNAPVIVGVGQVNRPPQSLDGPIALAAEALRLAAEDSGAGDKLLRRADSLRHVATTCWPYGDEAALIAAELGATPRETVRSAQFGGDGPQRLVSDTARAIARGQLDVALVSGAEAMAALRFAQKQGISLDWPDQPSGTAPTRVVGLDRLPSNDAETAVGLMAPVYNYALLETAVGTRSGLDRDIHMERVAGLWSRFSDVAAANPYARLRRRHSAEEVLTQTPENRPVSLPYPKLMTANIQVDQATGLIMCSAQTAHDAGVPRERWVFVHAGAHASDEWFLSERRDLAASPAIRAAGSAALSHVGITVDDVACVDLYSCFPCAVQIAAAELGLADGDRALTVTGGLTFAGGPGNNYSSHAIATLVHRLRAEPEAFGLCTALGWYLTKHAIGIYSARPPARPFRELDAATSMQRPAPRRADAAYHGDATIEAYTVPYGRDGEPEAVILTALADDGRRVLVRSTEEDLIASVRAENPVGQRATVAGSASASLYS